MARGLQMSRAARVTRATDERARDHTRTRMLKTRVSAAPLHPSAGPNGPGAAHSVPRVSLWSPRFRVSAVRDLKESLSASVPLCVVRAADVWREAMKI